MAYAGARGDTASQIADVFHFGTEPGIHDSFRALLETLDPADDARPFDLDVANALWPQIGFPFRDAFLQREDGLVDHRHQHPVGDEARRVVDLHRRLAHAPGEQGLADGGLDGVLLKRLRDQIGRLGPFPRQQTLREGRDENDRHILEGALILETAADLKPVQVRHHNIQKNEIRLSEFSAFQGRFAIS